MRTTLLLATASEPSDGLLSQVIVVAQILLKPKTLGQGACPLSHYQSPWPNYVINLTIEIWGTIHEFNLVI